MPPEDAAGYDPKEINVWKTEYDVITTLRESGHDVRPLGIQDELAPLRRAVEEWRPHIAFNLLEEFYGMTELDAHVVSYLELLRVKYTGCGPRGLVLARDKALAKKVLTYHRIRTAPFATFRRGTRGRLPRHLHYPVIVKGQTEESSRGISQASVVDSDERLAERVAFVHEHVGSDALVEQFIEGRELYVGVLGNRRKQVLPTWELVFENIPPGAAAIATERVKHDLKTQERWGIYQQPAEELPPEVEEYLRRASKRICRLLHLDGYARIDYRLSEDGRVYFLEANPNPEIAEREEFASAARYIGISYPELLERVLRLGLHRTR